MASSGEIRITPAPLVDDVEDLSINRIHNRVFDVDSSIEVPCSISTSSLESIYLVNRLEFEI